MYINIHMHTYMHLYICTCMIRTHEAFVNTSYTLSFAQGCIARGSATVIRATTTRDLKSIARYVGCETLKKICQNRKLNESKATNQ